MLLQTINSVDDIGEIINNWQFSGFIGVGFDQQTMEETMKIVKEPITLLILIMMRKILVIWLNNKIYFLYERMIEN